MAGGPTSAGGVSGRLRAGVIGAVAAGVMAMAFAAPSTSMFFNSPFAALNAGRAMPAAFLVSSIAIAFVAFSIAEFARKVPSAGYAYNYVSQGIGPRTGFISGWMAIFAFVGTPLIVPPVFGVTVADLVGRLAGVHVHWAVFSAILLLAVLGLAVLGISESLRIGAVFLAIEVGVLVLFSIFLIGRAGTAGNDLTTLLPTSAPSAGGLAVGLIFGILSFQGFEAAATLGEETRESKANVPLALMSAVLALGVFYTFVAYAGTVGWGASHMDSYAAAGTPWPILAQRYAGNWLSDLFDVVVSISLAAGTIASMNAGARILYAMGRERMLPSLLGATHPRTGTPWVAAVVITAVGGIGGVAYGLAWDPIQVWGFLGTVLALCAIVVYILVSVAVPLYYRRVHPAEFSLIPHALVPAIAIIIMLVPLAAPGGLLYPVPAYPGNVPPYLALAWLLVGAALLAILSRTRPEALDRAGSVLTE